jgi:serine/threonine-protein kinase
MAAGTKLGRYELLARIATGGMGEIFLARLEGAAGFEKLCVIKRILPHLADDSRFRAMLIGEARIASGMSHANICHVYALEETDHQLYMVMEYLEGVTLLDVLRATARHRQQLPLGFVAGVIQQACEGLHYAHELRDRSGASLGVVHRDVSPSNLFLTESGVVKLVDFGIAKVKDAAQTSTGEIRGKYAYMAPEQLRGQAIDRRVDVFSLGVVVFEMLTCRRLFHRKTDYLTIRALLEQPLLDVKEHRADVPDAVGGVLRRALERDPEARYPTARQLGAELLDALGVARPWSHSDISELVRTELGDELRVHRAEVAEALSASGSMQTIPLVAQPGASEAGDYFTLDSEIGSPPVRRSEVSLLRTRSDIGLLTASHAAQVSAPVSQSQSRPPRSAQPPGFALAMASRRRSRVLPVAAILGAAALVLAGGLVLVDRMSRSAVVHPAPAAGGTVAAASQQRASRERRPPSEPYGIAIRDHERELDQCARSHGDDLPAEATADIVVGADGRATQIALHPDSAERTKLGECIRQVLHAVTFPSGAGEKRVALGLALR